MTFARESISIRIYTAKDNHLATRARGDVGPVQRSAKTIHQETTILTLCKRRGRTVMVISQTPIAHKTLSEGFVKKSTTLRLSRAKYYGQTTQLTMGLRKLTSTSCHWNTQPSNEASLSRTTRRIVQLRFLFFLMCDFVLFQSDFSSTELGNPHLGS